MVDESLETLACLQELIDRSYATAGPAIRRGHPPDWRMSAEEFVAFWEEGRMASVSTTSASGVVHAAPFDPALHNGRFYLRTGRNSVRLKDHLANPRCAISSWDGQYRTVVVYGSARVTDKTVPTSDGGDAIIVEVTPTRIYAIRPPPSDPRAREEGPGRVMP